MGIKGHALRAARPQHTTHTHPGSCGTHLWVAVDLDGNDIPLGSRNHSDTGVNARLSVVENGSLQSGAIRGSTVPWFRSCDTLIILDPDEECASLRIRQAYHRFIDLSVAECTMLLSLKLHRERFASSNRDVKLFEVHYRPAMAFRRVARHGYCAAA